MFERWQEQLYNQGGEIYRLKKYAPNANTKRLFLYETTGTTPRLKTISIIYIDENYRHVFYSGILAPSKMVDHLEWMALIPNPTVNFHPIRAINSNLKKQGRALISNVLAILLAQALTDTFNDTNK